MTSGEKKKQYTEHTVTVERPVRQGMPLEKEDEGDSVQE